jgi:uncharacterized protein YjdB
MRKKQAAPRFWEIGLSICVLLFFGACGNPTGNDGTVPVTGVTVAPENPSAMLGETLQLQATTTPANATDKTITWLSSDPTVADVSNTGLVTAKALGNADIIAVSADGPSGKTTVTVVSPAQGITLTGQGEIIAAGTVISMAAGGSPVTIGAVVNPPGAVQAVTWASDNPGVVTVTNGVITAAGPGDAHITVSSVSDPGKTVVFTVRVAAAPIALTGITLNSNSMNLTKGGTDTLIASYDPADTTERGIEWSSSDPSVATVSNGVVVAAGGGTATITARSTAHTTISASCAVTVTTPLAGIQLSPNPLNIAGIGTTDSFTVVYDPADTTQTGLSWSSSNADVATVSGGTVAAVAVGTVTITAVSTADPSKTANATVNITTTEIPLTAITLSQDTLNLNKGGTDTLTVSYVPASATQQGVVWSSSDPTVATVSGGTVAAVAVGTAVITARSAANSTISASATVTVTAPLTGIQLSPASLAISGIGATGSLAATFAPTDTTQTGLAWSSSDPAVATVSNGVVTAAGGGTATITATSTTNSGISAAAMVTVIIPVTGITLNQTALSLNKGGTGTLALSYAPTNTTQRDVTWSSSNTTVATVSNGVVAAVGGGTATITATSTTDKTIDASCAVTVTAPLTGISLSPNPLAITGIGTTGSLAVALAPTDTTQTGLVWSSSDAAVATVSNGVVTAAGGGTATITATSTANSSISAAATVNVIIPVTGITLSETTLNLTQGDADVTLTPSFAPTTTTQRDVIWSSSAPAVATVSNGVVHEVNGGTTTITATSTADSTKTASCVV